MTKSDDGEMTMDLMDDDEHDLWTDPGFMDESWPETDALQEYRRHLRAGVWVTRLGEKISFVSLEPSHIRNILRMFDQGRMEGVADIQMNDTRYTVRERLDEIMKLQEGSTKSDWRSAPPGCEGCDVCQPWAGFDGVPLHRWINPNCEEYAKQKRKK